MNPRQAFVNLFAQAAGAAIVLLVLYFAETRFWPVVDNFKITEIQRTDRGVSLSGELVKRRPCEFVGMTIYGITTDGRRSLMHQFKTDIFGANVGVGFQDWGPVTVPTPALKFTQAEVLATHRCHPLWLQTTVYTTLDLSRVPG